jgi:hypothetical protein
MVGDVTEETNEDEVEVKVVEEVDDELERTTSPVNVDKCLSPLSCLFFFRGGGGGGKFNSLSSV